MRIKLIWLKSLEQCLAHIKNSINVSYAITILYYSVETDLFFVSLFVYMNRKVHQPGDQLRNQFFKRTENPKRSDLMAVQSQISSRSRVSNSCWPPVITDVEGRPHQSSQRELEKVLLWAEGGDSHPKGFPWSPIPRLSW